MQKLSKKAMILYIIKFFKDLIFPLIGIVVASFTTAWGLWGLLAVVAFALVLAVLDWKFTLYHVSDTDFHLYKGAFTKHKMVIAHSRIQTVDVTQSVIERLLGLTTLQIETPSGKGAEVKLVGLRLEAAEELKRKLLDEKAPISTVPSIEIQTDDSQSPDSHTDSSQKRIKSISSSELRLLSFSTFNIAVIFILWALFNRLSELLSDFQLGGFKQEVAQGVSQLFSGIDWTSQTMIMIEIFLAILVAWGGSALFTFIKFYRFQLTRLPSSFIIERGFFEKYRTSIQMKKIQAVRIVESPIRQLFGWVSIAVECTGKDDDNKEKDILFPFVRRANLEEFFSEYLPEFQTGVDVNLTRFSPIPLKKWIWLKVLISFAIAGGIYTFWLPSWQWTALIGIGISMGIVGYSWLCYLDGGYRLIGKTIVHRSRGISRVTEIVDGRSIQFKRIRQSPFYRKHNLVTWYTTLLTSKPIGIGHISHHEAEKFMEL
ncbi:PH domain-containing protein [Baia soyae]|uniref:Putative membrane protein YdbT with pleckstrin-like domain n=1 Tax=Baia soyae TaxID=1544746 RepID=A0A4R2S9G3_9BACL|nr:PH domain-containing protein [Baia soyae]TCP69051.1 putative membrane protein YdbT with pleckstrin-like domain [Baia soyae]